MIAGTSMVRTMSERRAMAVAMPRPIILMLRSVVAMGDEGGGGDRSAGNGEAGVDGIGVVTALEPLFVHPADEEDLVVHGQSE